MANAERDLMEWQVGKESVFGTGVVPTAKLMGIENGSIQPIEEAEHVPEMRGTLTPGFESILNKSTGEASVDGQATTEDLGYYLDSLLGEATTPETASPFTRTYNGPGAKPTPRIMTLVHGSAEDAKALVSAICNTLEITIERNARTVFAAGFIGHHVEDDEVESLADRTLNLLHGNQMKVFLDPFGSAAGSTEYTAIDVSATLSLDMNKSLVGELGDLEPADHSHQKGDPGSNQLTLSLLLDAAAGASVALIDAALDATSTPLQRVIRLEHTIDANNKLLIDFAGFTAEQPEIFADADGLASLEFVFSAQNEATLGGWLQIVLTNEIDVLP